MECDGVNSDMLRGLNEYVRTFHAKGLAWNMHGT